MNRNRYAVRFAFAFLALLGLASPASAGEQVPFRGSLDGDVTVTTINPQVPLVVQVDIAAAGRANHLGAFTVVIPHIVNRATRSAEGDYTFTAANGDTVTAHFTGVSAPTATPGVLYIEETATITGGTGRFAGATGSFTVERWYDTIAGTTQGSFEGTLSSPGSNKR
jgi:hypothetical protein